jgi:hypothetical protein
MPLNIYNLDPPISASAILRNDFQSLINSGFSEASDFYAIQEEDSFSSGSFINVNVRIFG